MAIQPITKRNKQGEERRKNSSERYTTQALTVSEAEKRRKHLTKKRLLQSIANGQLPTMLWSNVKALLRLKKNGKQIGKLRYKKKGRYKSLGRIRKDAVL